MTPGGSLFITAGFSFHPSFIGLFHFSPEQSLLDWAIAGLCLVCTVVLKQKKVFFGQKRFFGTFHLWNRQKQASLASFRKTTAFAAVKPQSGPLSAKLS